MRLGKRVIENCPSTDFSLAFCFALNSMAGYQMTQNLWGAVCVKMNHNRGVYKCAWGIYITTGV